MVTIKKQKRLEDLTAELKYSALNYRILLVQVTK